MVFHARHPFPADLLDHHGAMVAAILANVNKAQDHPTFELVDLLRIKPVPVVERPKPKLVEPPTQKPAMSEGRRIQAFMRAGR
jgi:hypothetical protein